MYAPNTHTWSVVPLWRVNNSSFILVSMERREKNNKF